MLKIIYSKDGELVGDYSAYDFVDRKIADYINSCEEHLEVRVANEVPFNIFSLRVMENVISEQEVEFYWEETKLIWDKYLGVEFPDSNTEFGIHLPVVNKILKLGYQKRMSDIKAETNKAENKNLWETIKYAANNMTGSEFCKWLSSENITYSTYMVEFGPKNEKWEININYNDKLIVCCYDEQDLLVRSNINS